jgi:hypothetical protein
LRVTCREGRTIAAEFLTLRPELAAGGAASGAQTGVSTVTAKTIKGGWDLATAKKPMHAERSKASGPVAVAIDPGQANLCA